VLNAVGPGKLVARFRGAGLDPVLPAGAEPTLAVALGGLGLRLGDLAALYAGLARGGETVSLTHRRETMSRQRPKQRALVSAAAAWYATDILKDAPPPTGARAGRIAYKTGTSYGYRDAWAVGYDGRHTIAVWVGRADGAATPGLTGRTAAAPILFDAFARISERRAPLPPAPPGIVAAGKPLPPPLKRFADGGNADGQGPFLEPPVAIVFPPDRAELEIEAQGDAVTLKADGGVLPLTWLIDGEPIASVAHAREAVWQPDGRGFVKVSVIDAKGRADRVTVRLR
ncbi:MAG: penicillin-binding protein 1C, partial [Hyphomicrobiaceae bacterium]